MLIGRELRAYLVEIFYGGATVLCYLLRYTRVGAVVSDELLQQFIAFVLLGIEEVGKRPLGNEHRPQELLIIKAYDVWQRAPVHGFLRLLAVFHANTVKRRLGVIVFHAQEADMPFGAIHHAVIGQEGELAVSRLSATCQDVAAVGRREPVVLALLRTAEYLYVLVAFALPARIARGTVVERKADGVEQGRLAAARRSHDAEYRAVGKCPVLKVDYLSFLTVERGEV